MSVIYKYKTKQFNIIVIRLLLYIEEMWTFKHEIDLTIICIDLNTQRFTYLIYRLGQIVTHKMT